MSSRGMKSFLNRFGATSIIAWTIVAGFMAMLYRIDHHSFAIKEAEREARDYFRLNMYYREWSAQMGGLYVPIEKVTPNRYLRIPGRDITTTENRQLTLVNPAYMSRMVFDLIRASSQDPIINKITGLRPLNPANAPDEWERQSLIAFERKQYKERSEVINISGKPYLRLISMFAAGESCLKCHARQGYRTGDVLGAIVISVPLSGLFELQRQADMKTTAGFVFLWAFGSSGIAIFSRRRALDAENISRLSAIVECSHDAIISNTMEGIVTSWNNGAEKLYGYSEQEVLGKSLLVISPDDCRKDEQEYIDNADCGKSAESFETVRVRKDGTPIDVSVTISPIRNQQGAMVGTSHVARDITERKRAENELHETRALLQAAMDCSSAGIAIADAPDGRLRYVNNAGLLIHGDNRPDIVAGIGIERCLETWLFLEPDGSQLQAGESPLTRAIMSGEECSREFIICRPDGNDRVVWVNAAPVRNESDAVTAAIMVFTDITERKKMETALRQSEFEFRMLAESMPQIVWATRPDGWNIYYNQKWVEYTGLTLEESYGHGWNKPFHPDDQRKAWDAWQQATSQRVTYSLECRLRRADGCYRWWLIRGVPLKDEYGTILKWYGTCTDIDDIKQVEAELLASNAMLEAALASMNDAFFISDAEGRFIRFNDAFATYHRFKSKDECAKTFAEYPGILDVFLANGDVAPIEQWAVPRALRGETATNAEYTLRRKDTGETWIGSYSFAPIRNEDGAIVGSVVAGRDITEIKQAEAEKHKLEVQLQQIQKMESIGRLAGGVAHDFNNMLGVILGHAELGLMHSSPSDPLRFDLEQIRDAAKRSADITRQLLAFARRQTVEPKVLDLNDSVAGMLKMLRRLIGEDIDLGWKPGTNLRNVKIDPSQLDQILANLCVNARDAIAGVGKIDIHTENIIIDAPGEDDHGDLPPGHYVMLVVSDNGCGMGKDILEHIFEPFYSTKEMGSGTGLGLATVFGIVKQNNGHISVCSEPGCGTAFRIYLPGEKSLPEGRTEEKQALIGGNQVVLLVEDEPAFLNLGKAMLSRLGYTVLPAHSPGQALRVAEEYRGRIDLLITDIIMPGMNGRDLADQIIQAFPGMKCLYMSGYTADVMLHRGSMGEDMCFLQKPFTMQSLADKVREALDRGCPLCQYT